MKTLDIAEKLAGESSATGGYSPSTKHTEDSTAACLNPIFENDKLYFSQENFTEKMEVKDQGSDSTGGAFSGLVVGGHGQEEGSGHGRCVQCLGTALHNVPAGRAKTLVIPTHSTTCISQFIFSFLVLFLSNTQPSDTVLEKFA